MTDDHASFKQSAAAYVLGALEPAERAEFERHLSSCSSCQAEVSGFAGLPCLLAGVSPDPVEDATAVDRLTRRATALVHQDFVHQQTTARRWKFAALTMAAAALIFVVAMAATLTVGGRGDQPMSVALQPGPASGTVQVDDRAWGTEISLDLEGLADRSEYFLWAVNDDGAWSPAATWAWIPGGVAKLTGSTSIPTSELEQVVVTSADRADVLAVATP